MKFFIYTFGCKTNTYESEALSRILSETGRFSEAESYIEADVIIVNSCIVTEESEKKARKLIRRMRRENEKACIVLCGCMPQIKKEKCLDTGADIVCGNTDRTKTLALIEEYFAGEKDPSDRIFDVLPHSPGEGFELLAPKHYRNLTRANLKIEDGCDCFCSYCVIPFARGRVRSMPVDKVFSVAKDLVLSGHREIVLTGINIGAYGKDIGADIYDAVKAVVDAGAERVRLGSVEIDLVSDETIEELAGIPELCPHFHTSLQSGSDRMLKKMLRRYDSAEYRRKIELLRDKFANASVTTDVIVGFPGETEEDFLETVKFVKEVGFFRVHVFPYSRRPGTAADKYPDQIPVEEKKRRVKIIEETTKGLKASFLLSQIGKTVNVLFESEGGIAKGHAENYVEVAVRTDENVKNRLLPVKISGVSGDGETALGVLL